MLEVCVRDITKAVEAEEEEEDGQKKKQKKMMMMMMKRRRRRRKKKKKSSALWKFLFRSKYQKHTQMDSCI